MCTLLYLLFAFIPLLVLTQSFGDLKLLYAADDQIFHITHTADFKNNGYADILNEWQGDSQGHFRLIPQQDISAYLTAGVTVSLLNASSNMIFSLQIFDLETPIDISGLQSGLYTLSLFKASGEHLKSGQLLVSL